MPVASALRRLDIDLPACPRHLVALGQLLAEDDAPLPAIATLIEDDLALAAAIVRSVNSAHFGLLRRVGTVAEALQHLGLREVAALAYAIGLRGVFPATPALEALWERARRRGRLMGASAGALGLAPWAAHTAGLFAEVGLAALHRHDAGLIQQIDQQPADTPLQRAAAEIACFGVSHAALGGALCQVWGLAPAVAEAVRQRPLAQTLVQAGDAPAASLLADWSHETTAQRRLLALLVAADPHPAEGEGTPALEPGSPPVEPDAAWAADTRRLAELGGLDAAQLLSALRQARLRQGEHR